MALVALAVTAGVGGATAATLAGGTTQPSGPIQSVTEPGPLPGPAGLDGDPANGATSRPAAIAIPQAAHAGAGYARHPLMATVRSWKPATATTKATPQLTNPTPTGYSPAQLRSYLELTGTGEGQTVAVIGAFDNPYARSDLATFSKQFGLPEPCDTKSAKGCFSFSSVAPFGHLGADPGWALESDLDVQMVHAIAPQAAIALVEAKDNSVVSLDEAIDYATSHLHPSVISNSWGIASEFTDETTNDTHCALTATLCTFSTGDTGNPGEYPAYDPHVLAVGGTTLSLTPSGDTDFEAGWCCAFGATGGGLSVFEPRPGYQDTIPGIDHRSIPDVSFDADPITGVPVYDTFGINGQNGWLQLGGTSAGAPAWAGIVAAADQLRDKAKQPPLAGAGFQAQRLIYGMPHTAFRDITTGVDNRQQCDTAVTTCQARPGYDSVTGWGSPGPGIDTALAAAH